MMIKVNRRWEGKDNETAGRPIEGTCGLGELTLLSKKKEKKNAIAF